MDHTQQQMTNPRAKLSTIICSGVFVLLWLLATTAAHASPKTKICHKPRAANQKILIVGQDALGGHLAHGDHEVGPELCVDEKDNDCDRVVDEDDCIATCPSACVDELKRPLSHVFADHDFPSNPCGFDENRKSGTSKFMGTHQGHRDFIVFGANHCIVALLDEPPHVINLSVAEQRACAPLAAQAVADITDLECDIDPP